MTPTQIFKKASAAYDVVKIVALLFWVPLIAMVLVAIYQNW